MGTAVKSPSTAGPVPAAAVTSSISFIGLAWSHSAGTVWLKRVVTLPDTAGNPGACGPEWAPDEKCRGIEIIAHAAIDLSDSDIHSHLIVRF